MENPMLEEVLLTEKEKKTFYREKHQQDADVCIVSYPKSGRTWLRLLLGKVICEKFGVDEALMLDTYKLTRTARLPRTVFTHDGAGIAKGSPYQSLETDKTKYRGKRVIFLYRDPRDVLVSSYFHASKRLGVYDGAMADFIRSDERGIKKCVTFYNIWHANQNVPEAFLLLRYEEMRKDTAGHLAAVLDFAGVENIDREIVDHAVSFASFDNLKKLETTGFFSTDRLRPGNPEDKESYKVRQGKVGGYVDYFSQEDIEYMDSVIAEMGCPFCS